jgi:hypothetical protein
MLRILRCVAVCASTIGVLASCDTDVDEKTLIISGIVQSAATKLPVKSAWIALADSVQGARHETDSLGAFAFSAPPWTEHLLFIGATGYLTYDTTLKKAEDELENIVVELTPSP